MLGRPLDIYTSYPTSQSLRSGLYYAFNSGASNDRPFTKPKEIHKSEQIGDIQIHSFKQFHGNNITKGLGFDNVAYGMDFKALPGKFYNLLHDLDLWIIIVLGRETYPTQGHLSQGL